MQFLLGSRFPISRSPLIEFGTVLFRKPLSGGIAERMLHSVTFSVIPSRYLDYWACRVLSVMMQVNALSTLISRRSPFFCDLT
jgi:hypothetical protein